MAEYPILNWPNMDFRKIYLVRMGWTNKGEYWTCSHLDYWTTLEDAVSIQFAIEEMHLQLDL